MSAQNPWIPYHFAILRVVPHVHLGQYVNVGVVLHARTADFLGLRAIADPDELQNLVQEVDIELLSLYLSCYDRICRGDSSAGPLALLPPSERFHWLTAPRSDVLQTSAVHEGIALDPEAALGELFGSMMGR